MKRLLMILLFAFTMIPFAVSGMQYPTSEQVYEVEKARKEAKQGKCPKTKVVGKVADCLLCHVIGDFRVIETAPDAINKYPYNTKLTTENGENVGYYYLTKINDDEIREFFEYLQWHGVKHAVIEIFSPGGSLFGAWRIVGFMNMAKSRGVTVETRCHSFAASAGFLIFISGSMGHRSVNPTIALMWHELLSFKMFAIESPSSSEDEAKILRGLQDTANSYIASRSKLTKDELDNKVKRQELWVSGKQALEYGLADKPMYSGEPYRSLK